MTDWTTGAACVFKRVIERKNLEFLTDHEPASDLALAFEMAVCAQSPLCAVIGLAMAKRKIPLRLESMLRIARWPSLVKRRILLADVRTMAPLEKPTSARFVGAVVAASSQPAHFCRLLELCPEIELTPREADNVVAVAWEATMQNAISRSWIDGQYPAAWLEAPLGLRERAMSQARRDFEQAEPIDAVGCYWTEDERCPALERADGEVDLVDETAVPGESIDLVRAVNTFCRHQDRLAHRRPAAAVCPNPLHVLCAELK